MNKESTKEEIYNKYCYDESKSAMLNAMQEFAAQEKKKEAIAFGEFLKKNYVVGITTETNDAVWLSIHVNDENEYTEEQLYKFFNQQNERIITAKSGSV